MKEEPLTDFPFQNDRESVTSFGQKMRKYYKLILVVVTVISLVCFIFYKTQYDKLYYVLQVLEVYGSDPNVKGTPVCPITPSALVLSPPSWQRVADGVFVYSAFCDFNGPESVGSICPMVTALALAKKGNTNLRCKLWYEGTLQPVEGIFASRAEGKSTEGFNAFLFTCESKYSNKQPYGVTFTTGDQSDETFLRVDVPAAASTSESVSLCLAPATAHTDVTTPALENVLLHNHFGVQDFFVYDFGHTNRFFRTLAGVRAERTLNVHVLPWNLPAGGIPAEAVRFLAETDCHYRTKTRFQTTAFLKLEQIIVPKSSSSVDGALKDLGRTGKLAVDVLRFCSEYPSDPKSSSNEYSLVPLEMSSFNDALSSTTSLYHKLTPSSDAATVPREILTVNDYSECGEEGFEDKGAKKDLTLVSAAKTVQEDVGRFFQHKNI